MMHARIVPTQWSMVAIAAHVLLYIAGTFKAMYTLVGMIRKDACLPISFSPSHADLITRHNLLLILTFPMSDVSGLSGQLAVVINPPASSTRQMPATTCHSQPPSHQMSKLPIVVYARSMVAFSSDLIPWTMLPFPSQPPISAAELRKQSSFRCRLPSRICRLHLPHSQEKIHFAGAFVGFAGIALA